MECPLGVVYEVNRVIKSDSWLSFLEKGDLKGLT